MDRVVRRSPRQDETAGLQPDGEEQEILASRACAGAGARLDWQESVSDCVADLDCLDRFRPSSAMEVMHGGG
jgi:hypothetical protein